MGSRKNTFRLLYSIATHSCNNTICRYTPQKNPATTGHLVSKALLFCLWFLYQNPTPAFKPLHFFQTRQYTLLLLLQ